MTHPRDFSLSREELQANPSRHKQQDLHANIFSSLRYPLLV